MRNQLLLLSILGCSMFAHAQKLITKEFKPKAGEEIHLIYQPATDKSLPDELQAQIVYHGKYYANKIVALKKEGAAYTAAFTPKDSISLLVVGIIDKAKNIIDDNAQQGYIVYLNTKEGNAFTAAKVDAAILLSGYAPYVLKLKVKPESILNLYETGFADSKASEDDNYVGYLSFLYKQKGEAVKEKMAVYANNQLAKTGKEKNWINALQIYRLLKRNDDVKELYALILKTYPTGITASQKFMSSFYESKNPDSLVIQMNTYYQIFVNVKPLLAKDDLIRQIASLYGEKKDWSNFEKYIATLSSKDVTASLYNNTAWALSGKGIEKEASELDYAQKISSISLGLIQASLHNAETLKPEFFETAEEYRKELSATYQMYADTYALILYKLNKPDSALYYQTITVTNNKDVNEGELERFTVYAEKAKGKEFARPYLEEYISSGKGTAAMKTQLKAIYTSLNLSDESYNSIINKSEEITAKNTVETMKSKMKNYSGKDFTLKNLAGETVSLSKLKGKIVVLDFWATWCGPCKGSFPGMQLAVNKYKADKDVVFLFIDTWEKKEPKVMKQQAEDFIKANKYTFNVLLDETSKVIGDYDVEGIPTKFIIDKKGKVKYMSVGGTTTEELLKEITYMIEDVRKA